MGAINVSTCPGVSLFTTTCRVSTKNRQHEDLLPLQPSMKFRPWKVLGTWGKFTGNLHVWNLRRGPIFPIWMKREQLMYGHVPVCPYG